MTLIPIQVTDEAVIIPKVYLHDAREVEVEITADYVIVRPKSQPTKAKDKPIHIYTPRIADSKRISDFKMEVTQESEMTQYDSENFDPPAPVATVTIRNPETGATARNVPMLIDTGADATLIPRSVADQLGLAGDSSSHYELAGFDGARSYATAVQADLIMSQRTFRGQFLIVDQPFGILGRNVLNSIPLFLDGPRLSWNES